MKIRPSRQQNQRGSALLVVLIIIVIMLAFAVANTVTVNTLARQVKVLDQRQIHRLAAPAANPPLSK